MGGRTGQPPAVPATFGRAVLPFGTSPPRRDGLLTGCAVLCGIVRGSIRGMRMRDQDLAERAADDAIAAGRREELARRRISRQALADMARISLSTLEKALSGSRGFTLATVIRLEEALG